jgi:hypothetical protein
MGPAAMAPPSPPSAGYSALPPQTAFDNQAFVWSAVAGPGSLSGTLAYRRGQQRYVCQGDDVLLIPETPWSQRRMMILYGSASATAVPVSIVRARTPSAPTGDYARYVRKTTCDSDNHFAFQGLPRGAWYVITIGRTLDGKGEPIAVTRRVDVVGGSQSVTMY